MFKRTHDLPSTAAPLNPTSSAACPICNGRHHHLARRQLSCCGRHLLHIHHRSLPVQLLSQLCQAQQLGGESRSPVGIGAALWGRDEGARATSGRGQAHVTVCMLSSAFNRSDWHMHYVSQGASNAVSSHSPGPALPVPCSAQAPCWPQQRPAPPLLAAPQPAVHRRQRCASGRPRLGSGAAGLR